MAQEWDLPEIGLRRLSGRDIAAFWTGYARIAAPGLVHGSLYSRWRPVSEDCIISLYITNRSVGLFVRGERGERWATTAVRLEAYEPRLGKALGASLRGYPGCCYLGNHRIPTLDTGRWPEAYAWLDAAESRYAATLRKVLRVTE